MIDPYISTLLHLAQDCKEIIKMTTVRSFPDRSVAECCSLQDDNFIFLYDS